jgi:hypothetical protein
LPNRILREGILTSPLIARLGWAEEVFYRRLMSVVDDFGRYYADHGMLRAACFPRQLSKVSDSDIGKWLQVIADAGLVRVYPAQDGERYLELLKFGQQVRAKKSKFPDPISACAADATQTPANAHLDVSVSVDVSGGGSPAARSGDCALFEEDEPPSEAVKAKLAVVRTPSRFEDFWAMWPRSQRKVDRKACAEKWARKRLDAEADAILADLDAQKRSRQWLDGFEPAPLTYLNRERWRDGVECPAAASVEDERFAGAL